MHFGILQSLMCKAGLHAWNRPRRVKGFRIRRCAGCHLRQAEQFPGPTWVTTVPIKRVRGRTKREALSRSEVPTTEDSDYRPEHSGSRAVEFDVPPNGPFVTLDD